MATSRIGGIPDAAARRGRLPAVFTAFADVYLSHDDAERAAQLDELLDEHHPEQPCFYLQFMGVVPEHRGRGLGSRMLQIVLQRCDATGTPAYLEATSVDNRRLYERHGSETVGELALPGGPSLWSMWRAPIRGKG